MNTVNSKRFKVRTDMIEKRKNKPLPSRTQYTLWDYIVADIEKQLKQ